MNSIGWELKGTECEAQCCLASADSGTKAWLMLTTLASLGELNSSSADGQAACPPRLFQKSGVKTGAAHTDKAYEKTPPISRGRQLCLGEKHCTDSGSSFNFLLFLFPLHLVSASFDSTKSLTLLQSDTNCVFIHWWFSWQPLWQVKHVWSCQGGGLSATN